MANTDRLPHTCHGYLDTNPNTEPMQGGIVMVTPTYPNEAEAEATTKEIAAASKPSKNSKVLVYSAGT